MKEIRRYDINEDWAHAGIIQAGDYCFKNKLTVPLMKWKNGWH